MEKNARHTKQRLQSIIKMVGVCVLVVCLLGFVVPPSLVQADALVELDDSFWEKHNRECEYVFREYTVNSPAGYAVLWESPISSKQEEAIVNGTKLWSNWHYTDDSGEVWCVITGNSYGSDGRNDVRGWIKTSDCLVTLDYISFWEVYNTEFVGYDSAYDHAFDDVETVKLWAYPCSGVVKGDQIEASWFQENVTPSEYFDTCWKDPQGRLWAFVGYCYGVRNTWICLDDPAGTSLEENSEQDLLAQGEEMYSPVDPNAGANSGETADSDSNSDNAGDSAANSDSTSTDTSVGNKGDSNGSGNVLSQDAVIYPPAEKLPLVKNGVTGLTIAGVLAVVIVTVGLIWFFFGRKKDK